MPIQKAPAVSIFADLRDKAYPYRFQGVIHCEVIAGGTPTNEKVAESWLKTKLADKDDLIQEMVAKTMVERGVSAEEAVAIVDITKHLNGFKLDTNGLYIEGRQLKAGIKEAANVRWPKAKWGPSNKGTLGFFAEHFFVEEDRLYLHTEVEDGDIVPVQEPSGVMQRFVHTWRGTGIQYEEFVEKAHIPFTLVSDFELDREKWGLLWLTGQQQGLGASRSQGYGRYTMISWEQVK